MKPKLKKLVTGVQTCALPISNVGNNKFPEISLENSKREFNNNITPIPKTNTKTINSITDFLLKRKEINSKNKK